MERFIFAATPKLHFGLGVSNKLVSIIKVYGERVLLVLGNSFLKSKHFSSLELSFRESSIHFTIVIVKGEPSPEFIDEQVKLAKENTPDCVLGIGGGSVIDAGKAIAAMYPLSDSVMDYLEGIGSKKHPGDKLPFIACPTTAGTGSEATKNAVITNVCVGTGFKKSMRNDNFVPNVALIDPDLILSCPANVSASCGIDAFTQCLEAYVSTNSNTITDALCLIGIEKISNNLVRSCTTDMENVEVRSNVAMGAYISGIVLANAGLGIVHGLAGPIGGLFSIPHGVICGALLVASTKINIARLLEQEDSVALVKYARIGNIVCDETLPFDPTCQDDIEKNCSCLIDTLRRWVSELGIRGLGSYGVTEVEISSIISLCGMKNNPVKLTHSDLNVVLLESL